MEKRTESILAAIISEYLKTAQPVGSGVIVEVYKLGISSATVRNEMAALEEQGFIMQPHTSAGRIPTIQAYKFFANKINARKLNSRECGNLHDLLDAKDEQGLKRLARELATLANAAVFWAIHRRNLYYTGISNLLTQPEFRESNLIYDISGVIDRMEEIIETHFSHFNTGVQLLIGDDNPFSNHCSVLTLKYKMGGHIGLVGILGPVRMDYERNFSLLEMISEKIKD
jgi:transcriptional regulator of heat shock response